VRDGRRAAFTTVAGLEVGVAFWAVAAGLGLSALLVASEVAYQALRVAGELVLLWFGVRASSGGAATSRSPLAVAGSGRVSSSSPRCSPRSSGSAPSSP